MRPVCTRKSLGTAACLPFAGQFVSQLGQAPVSATLQVVYLGLFPTTLGFTTWAYALAQTTSGRMGATIYAVPTLVIIMSWLILGQVPRWLAAAGGALCLAGVAVSRSRSRADQKASEATPILGADSAINTLEGNLQADRASRRTNPKPYRDVGLARRMPLGLDGCCLDKPVNLDGTAAQPVRMRGCALPGLTAVIDVGEIDLGHDALGRTGRSRAQGAARCRALDHAGGRNWLVSGTGWPGLRWRGCRVAWVMAGAPAGLRAVRGPRPRRR